MPILPISSTDIGYCLSGLGAISRLVNIWFVKPGLNVLNSASPLSIVHIEPIHACISKVLRILTTICMVWVKKIAVLLPFPFELGTSTYFLWRVFRFSFLFLSLFQSFSRLFITSSSVSFLVFLLLFNHSASVLCSNSFRSPSVHSPASEEFTRKFTVYSSPWNRFLMGVSTLRSIWTTIH